ncbi:hypothetical protein A9Q99_01655 [Gammaproteobacteria bacterium 45_16_T64]|mgnify:CR=1 FL=1|nr:hypothetical protein A9Q99_01655 [Gammaproteobacteria bacterium 45_16_T64]
MIETDTAASYLEYAKVLLIDDSEPFQMLTSEMLKKFGVSSVSFASTLVDGLRKLKYSSHDAFSRPDFDLVLLDVNLPDGNGVHGCDFVTHHAATLDIPVVVISGAYVPNVVEEAFNSGASDFLQKPFVGSLLKQRLGSVLMNHALKDPVQLV